MPPLHIVVRGVLFFLAGVLSPLFCAAQTGDASLASDASALSRKNILLVSTYNSQSSWADKTVEGFSECFTDGGYYISKIELGVLNNRTLEPLESDIHWIVDKLKQRKAGTIVALDQGAIDIVVKKFDQLPRNLNVVLGGTVGTAQGAFPNGVFAVQRKLNIEENLRLGAKLFPGAKKVFILTGGNSGGCATNAYLKKRLAANKDYAFVFVNGRESSTPEMLEMIRSEQKEDFYVIFFNWISIKDSEHVPAEIVGQLVLGAAHTRVLNAYTTGKETSWGGCMTDPLRLGEFIGLRTRDIIEKDFGARTVEEYQDYTTQINWKYFKNSGISRGELPENTVFYNTPPPLLGLAEYRYMVGALALISALVILVFILFFRHTRAQSKNLEIFKTIPVGVCIFRGSGEVVDSYGEFGQPDNQRDISIFGPEFVSFFRENLDELNEGKEASLEFMLNGEYRKGIIRKLSVEKFGSNVFVLTTMDVSDLVDIRKDLQETTRRLRDSNTSLKVIIDNIPCGIFVKNYGDAGKYVLGNKFFRHNLAHHPEPLEGKTDYEVFPTATARLFIADDQETILSGKLLDRVEDVRTTDGAYSKCHTIKTTMKMENGDVFLFGIGVDITELARTQEKMKLQSEQMRMLNECLHSALLSRDLETLFTETIRLVGENLGASRSYFVKYDEPTHRLTDIYEWTTDPAYARDTDFLRGDLPNLKVCIDKFTRNEMIHSDDVAGDETLEFSASARMNEFRDVKSLLAIGVLQQKKVWGFISIEFLDKGRNVTESDKHLLYSVARILEIAVERFDSIAKVEENERLRTLVLDSINIPIILLDANRKVLSANSAALRLSDNDLQTMTQRPCHETVCKGMFDEITCPVVKCMETGKEMTNDVVAPNGMEFHVTMTPIFDKDQKLKYVVENMLDMTEFNEGKRKLEKAMHEAQAADKAKSYFIATMSHELRTPLNAVIGYTELTQDPDLSQRERMHNLKNISFAANTLLNLINDILDLSKLEAGQMEISKSPVDMAFVAEEFSRVFKFSANKNHIAFDISVSQGCPMLMLDALRLKQVLMNLIGNAIKFTGKGGVTVNFIFDKTDESSGTLSIEIRDTGVGIGPEFLGKIFNPFTQDIAGHTRRRGVHEGTGLGLPIVKRLVEKMGGEIKVESRINIGSRFFIRIPGVEIAAGAQGTAEQKPDPAASSFLKYNNSEAGNDLTVMVLDDIAMNVKVLSKMLQNFGVTVIESTSPVQALEMLQKDRPNIIMTDLWMPEMDGLEFARAVRAMPEVADTLIIAVTADSQIQDPDGVFNDILLKPITMKSVSEKIQNVRAQKKA